MTQSLIRVAAATAFALCFSAMPAAASPVTWQVSNVDFDDGGTLAGTFIFDAATGAYSSIDLSSTAGTTITSNRHYGSPFPPSPGNSSLLIAVANASLPLEGQDALVLTWGADLTDAGITTTVLPRALGFSFEGYVNNVSLPGLRNVISTGTVAAVTSVPEPGTLALAALALTAVAALRRCKLG
jgi:hypothetical protein